MATTYFKAAKGNITHSGTENNQTGNIGLDKLTYTGSATQNLWLTGGIGQDTLTNSGTGVVNEYLSGGTFASKIYGGNVSGTEFLTGHAGSDLITSGTGNALIYGGATGNDSLYAGSGNVTIVGGAGRDSIKVTDTVTTHHHTLFGGTGAATLDVSGVTGTNSLTNNNTLYGGAGNDTLIGSAAANDLFNPGTGTDVITGNAGNIAHETLGLGWSGSAYTQGVLGANVAQLTVNLTSGIANETWQSSATGAVQTVSDTFTNIGNVNGSLFNDSITGSTGANLINTSSGNDTVDSGAGINTGNDTINGGVGNKLYYLGNGTQGNGAATSGDVIIGGSGQDTLDFTHATTAASVLPTSFGSPAPAGYTVGTVTGVYANLSYGVNIGAQTWSANFAGAAGEGTITGISVLKGTVSLNDYMEGATGVTLQGGGGNETLVGGAAGSIHDTLVNNSLAANGTIMDGQSSTMSNWFEVGNNAATVMTGSTGGPASENIYGYSEYYGDKIYIKASAMADLGTLSGTGMTATSVTGTAVDNGTFTANYSASLNAAGTHNLSSFTWDSTNFVQSGAVSGGNFAGLTAVGAHAFLFDTATGNLWYNNAATVATQSTATLTEIAHIDLTSATATGGAPLATLSTADFIFSV